VDGLVLIWIQQDLLSIYNGIWSKLIITKIVMFSISVLSSVQCEHFMAVYILGIGRVLELFIYLSSITEEYTYNIQNKV